MNAPEVLAGPRWIRRWWGHALLSDALVVVFDWFLR